jgi:hypothetical protein
MVDGVGQEGSRRDGGHTQADLLQVADKIFEVDIVIGIVVEGQLLPRSATFHVSSVEVMMFEVRCHATYHWNSASRMLMSMCR